ncbi:MAG: RNA-binding protein [Bacteroidetes bacterium]|nr:MAG: RNA-binding protein [Bacteroidota bacterium]
MKRIQPFLFFLLFLAAACSSPHQSSGTEQPLFVLMNEKETGLHFVNQVEDQKDFNILTYRNFYNGGGVALGDVNHDGLPDLYFTANMGPNKLFLNRGNWQFEDVTAQAGVAGSRAWSTGVTMVDVNADGWLDIYVCNSGDIAGANKENELFINQGVTGATESDVPTFIEAAKAWGLNNEGFSTHASFFDYDGDGDLDCYLLNNSFRSPDRIEFYQKTRDQVDTEGGDKLFRNEGDHFSDVSLEAGIYTSDIGFGLGVSVSDLNGDMWPDIYVSNDFWERDYLYINQGDGTFSEELSQRTDLCSLSSMGADIADLNNDGAPEIFTTDMLPGDNFRLKTMTQFAPFYLESFKKKADYHHQILQNCLHLNDGSAHFQEIAQLVGVAATDWSWGALLFDFDNDGWKDIFVSNGIRKDLTDLDFVDFISDRSANSKVRELVTETRRADFRDFLPYMPETKVANYALRNQGDLLFVNEAAALGLAAPSFSNGAAYGDLDLDGDLDLVINNVNMPAFLYQNRLNERNSSGFLAVSFKGEGANPLGIGARVSIYAGGRQQQQQHYMTRGFESSVPPGLVFGTGSRQQVDSLVVVWPDRRMQKLGPLPTNQRIELVQADAKERFRPTPQETDPLFAEETARRLPPEARHVENVFNDFDHEPLLPRMLSTEGPNILTGDVNGDQLEDFVLLQAAGQPNQLFLQTAAGNFRLQEQAVFLQDQEQESTCGALFDADGDGDLDLMIGNGGNEYQKGFEHFLIQYYVNDGKGNFYRDNRKTPALGGNFSCVVPGDLDADGDLDVFIGGRAIPGNYGLVPASFLLLNNGDGSWTNITDQTIGTLGMVTAASWSDTDADGDQDLLLVGDWMPVTILLNEGGKLAKKVSIAGSEGWWTALQPADLDQDGDPDFVLGNWGLNTKFKASREKPLRMYVKDFDQNGKSDILLDWYPPEESTSYPFAGKMDLTRQLPHLKKEALKYEAYARKRYEDLFSPDERQQALQWKASYLQTAVLWNEGGSFQLQALPIEAQFAPVFAIMAADFNADQLPDLFLGGNFFGLKPEVGRHAANKGLCLINQGNRRFTALSHQQSGLYIQGEMRDARPLKKPDGSFAYLLGINNAPLRYFSLRK